MCIISLCFGVWVSSTLMWCSTICCKQVNIAVLRASCRTGTFLEGHSSAMLTSLLDIWHISLPVSSVATAALSLPVDLSTSGILDLLLFTAFVISLVFIHFLDVSQWCFNLSFKDFWVNHASNAFTNHLAAESHKNKMNSEEPCNVCETRWIFFQQFWSYLIDFN